MTNFFKNILIILWRITSQALILMLPIMFFVVGLNIIGIKIAYSFILGLGLVLSGLYEIINFFK